MNRCDSTPKQRQGARNRLQRAVFWLIASILLILASTTLVLASDVSNADYYGVITISNNNTAATNVAANCTINTGSLITQGFLNSSANNCAVQNTSGADIAFMPSVNASYPWCFLVPSIGADSYLSYILYTGNVTGGEIRYFPGLDGMTTADSASLEPGANFTIEQSGWVDTSSGEDKLLVDKGGAFRTLIGSTGNITSLLTIEDNIWTQSAPQLGAETFINALAVYNGKLYGGTSPNGKLYEWNGVNLWVEVAPKLGAETGISALAVYNGKLYGGTNPNGKLYEWNGVNLWVEVAPKLGAETFIHSLAVYNGKLYGGTGILTGELYEWNGVNLWVQVAPQLGAEARIRSLVVYNDKLYGGTHPNGKLYEWNGVNLWVEVAPKLGAETAIISLADYNGKLYGGTNPNGKLYEWNGVNLWVEVAPQLGAETVINALAVYNGKLYGGTGALTGELYEWNGVNLWVQVAPQLGAETYIFSLAVYNGYLYGGTGVLTGELYEWGEALSVSATGVASGNHTVTTTANITHMWIDIDTITQDTVALTGESVIDNSDNFTFLQNDVMPYMEYQEISVDGVQVQYIEWEYSTTFNDTSGYGNDATPTFRTTSSDPHVSALLTLFQPVEESQAPAWSLDTTPSTLVSTNTTTTGNFSTTPTPTSAPFIAVIEAVSTATATPSQLPFTIIAGFVILATSLGVSHFMKKNNANSLIIKLAVIILLFGIFIALDIFDFWMLIFFLIPAVAIIMLKAQGQTV